MNQTRPICGDCVQMRDSDGYCPRAGAYINFFAEAPRRCFTDRYDIDEGNILFPPVGRELHSKPSRKHWRSGYDTPPGYKYCPTCNRVLPISDFGQAKGRHNGVTWECKPCANARARRLKAARREYSIGQDKPSSAKP